MFTLIDDSGIIEDGFESIEAATAAYYNLLDEGFNFSGGVFIAEISLYLS